jgi:hypothetical protein
MLEETPSATLRGMEMEGRARDSLANEPNVDEARRRRSAERIRDSVDSLRGRDPD